MQKKEDKMQKAKSKKLGQERLVRSQLLFPVGRQPVDRRQSESWLLGHQSFQPVRWQAGQQRGPLVDVKDVGPVRRTLPNDVQPVGWKGTRDLMKLGPVVWKHAQNVGPVIWKSLRPNAGEAPSVVTHLVLHMQAVYALI